MRTIKFRGKRCDNGEWAYGYYARLSNEFKEWHCIMTEKDASENYIKACKWLKDYAHMFVSETTGDLNEDDLINNFRKDMKGD